jgi:2,4-dienoyl-CoA reductase-like NADH-dependent reductase (Old Yellow Enzyme family)
MNKRINLLAIQAGGIWQGGYVEQANGDSVYTEHKFVHGGDMDVEQFARLLIQECIDIVGIGGEFASRPKLVEKLQEHFGVEE